jgi:hypothetical protein
MPEAHADIDALLRSRSYGKAWGAVQKALTKSPDDAALKAAADWMTQQVEAKLAAAKDAETTEYFDRAAREYRELTEQYAGVPGAEGAKAALDALKKRPEAKEELAAADKLDAALQQFRKGDLEKAVKAFGALARKSPETSAGKRAAELAELHPLD